MRHSILLLAAVCLAFGTVAGLGAASNLPPSRAPPIWLPPIRPGSRRAIRRRRSGSANVRWPSSQRSSHGLLPIPRERLKAELSAGLGALYVTRTRGVAGRQPGKGDRTPASRLEDRGRGRRTPQDWAAAHNALGIAYWQRIRGERADNQETAIAHFEAAQTVFSREAVPEQWAQLQNNLAVVYWSRIRGDRAQNVEEAIARFEAALTVFTREKDPDRWAAAQNNLANAYGKRLRGDAGRQSRDGDRAPRGGTVGILARYPSRQWAQAQNNLAIAYLARMRGNAADNQEKAIASLEAALGVFTRDATPQQWAQAQHNLGKTYAGRIQGERTSNRQKAIASFEAALTVFTRDAAPLDHLRTSRLLGRVLLEAGEWTRVAPIHASAREAFLLLFGQGVSEAEARALIADAGPLFADSAYAALQRHETEKAFELANEGRARLLAVALKLQTVDLPADQRRRLDELRVAIRAGQEAADAAQGTERAAAIDRLIGLRRELFAHR